MCLSRCKFLDQMVTVNLASMSTVPHCPTGEYATRLRRREATVSWRHGTKHDVERRVGQSGIGVRQAAAGMIFCRFCTGTNWLRIVNRTNARRQTKLYVFVVDGQGNGNTVTQPGGSSTAASGTGAADKSGAAAALEANDIKFALVAAAAFAAVQMARRQWAGRSGPLRRVRDGLHRHQRPHRQSFYSLTFRSETKYNRQDCRETVWTDCAIVLCFVVVRLFVNNNLVGSVVTSKS